MRSDGATESWSGTYNAHTLPLLWSLKITVAKLRYSHTTESDSAIYWKLIT